jgi:tetratricopeptide (TPR) repeat protein
VRADDPFKEVQVPVRGTVAIDMEGAAFGLITSRHPLIPWLVVKGVSDYADGAKSDAYHGYAARASALYALSFIWAYVTNERLPRDRLFRSSQEGLSGAWHVPYARNPYFTGRDDVLNQLQQHLSPEGQNDLAKIRRTALTQPRAIKGLGGIGKTQIAVEFAYRSRDLKRYTHTLWVNAASEETIVASFVGMADLLPSFFTKNETDQRKLVNAVKRWLEQSEHRWLLIFDNADADDLSFVQDYFPQQGNGSILLTTRANAVSSIATSIEVEKMGFMESSCFLLRRVYGLADLSTEEVFEHVSDENVNEAGNIVVALDHFPLALDQAGAYIEETSCSLSHYLELYRTHSKTLRALRGKQSTNYPESVATTWEISFQKVKQSTPAATELLHLCAFLAPDAIPEELISMGVPYWPSPLQQTVADPVAFDQAIAKLLTFSLVKRDAATNSLSIHRLVQAVLLDTMEQNTQREWAERIIYAVNKVFPLDPTDVAMWQQCLRYLDQVQACNTLIEVHMLLLAEAADVFNRAGMYLNHHALYTLAEQLYQRALAIREQQLGEAHPDTAFSLNDLADLYEKQGKYRDAEAFYQRALAAREQWLGPYHPDLAGSLDSLAGLYEKQGKDAEAEQLYQRALIIFEDQLGETHPNTASAISGLAGCAQDQGRYAEAEPLYQRALHIREQTLGPEHPYVAFSLNDLALLYQQQDRYAEAEALYRRALAIYTQQVGPPHPRTATTLNNLADLYARQGKYAEAESLCQDALAIQEQQFGPQHPKTATGLGKLAFLYEKQGKDMGAELLYQRALAIWEHILGPKHPDIAFTLTNLAVLYEKQEKYAEAEPLLQRALSLRERGLGPEHIGTAASLSNLARLYEKWKKYAEAESLYRRALTIDEHAYGGEHREVVYDLRKLVHLYIQQGKDEEAEPLYQRALCILAQQLGTEHPETQEIREEYAMLLRTRGSDAEASGLETN